MSKGISDDPYTYLSKFFENIMDIEWAEYDGDSGWDVFTQDTITYEDLGKKFLTRLEVDREYGWEVNVENVYQTTFTVSYIKESMHRAIFFNFAKDKSDDECNIYASIENCF